MELEDCIAKSAKKIVKSIKFDGSEIGVFKDTVEGISFYCVAWREKEKAPKFKFYTYIDDAMKLFRIINEVI